MACVLVVLLIALVGGPGLLVGGGVVAWVLCGELAKYLRRHPEVVKVIIESLAGPLEAKPEAKKVKGFMV